MTYRLNHNYLIPLLFVLTSVATWSQTKAQNHSSQENKSSFSQLARKLEDKVREASSQIEEETNRYHQAIKGASQIEIAKSTLATWAKHSGHLGYDVIIPNSNDADPPVIKVRLPAAEALFDEKKTEERTGKSYGELLKTELDFMKAQKDQYLAHSKGRKKYTRSKKQKYYANIISKIDNKMPITKTLLDLVENGDDYQEKANLKAKAIFQRNRDSILKSFQGTAQITYQKLLEEREQLPHQLFGWHGGRIQGNQESPTEDENFFFFSILPEINPTNEKLKTSLSTIDTEGNVVIPPIHLTAEQSQKLFTPQISSGGSNQKQNVMQNFITTENGEQEIVTVNVMDFAPAGNPHRLFIFDYISNIKFNQNEDITSLLHKRVRLVLDLKRGVFRVGKISSTLREGDQLQRSFEIFPAKQQLSLQEINPLESVSWSEVFKAQLPQISASTCQNEDLDSQQLPYGGEQAFIQALSSYLAKASQ